jgi:predicted double-glycine peptidase
MFKLPPNLRSHPSALVQAYAIAAGVLTLALIPLLSTARAAGPHKVTASTQSSVASAKHAAAKRTSSKVKRAGIAVHIASKASASLGPLETIVQTLNNCGPSSVASLLAYWHVYRSEAQVASVLRADNAYWGMSPADLPVYARSLGLRALVGYGGSERLVKLLIANGFPVIASQYVSSSDAIRHYRPIEAYNDATGTFVSADPYLGAGHVISYSEFNAIWAESDYRFQVIYPPSLQTRLNAVLRAAGWNQQRAFSGAIRWEEAQMNMSDFSSVGSWIWYNGYADVAFDQAQLGQFKQAQATLARAARQGVSSVLIGWVNGDIALLKGQR